MTDGIACLVVAFLLLAFVAQSASILLVLFRMHARGRKGARLSGASLEDNAGVSVLRPVCGMDFALEETLASTFQLRHAPLEILFCVESPEDAALPLLRALIAANPGVDARILIGRDPISGNPKLNNLVKGWNAARHDWIVMADSNFLLPPDYIETLLARWDDRTGLVSSPPFGMHARGLWGALESAFLNTYQARWQFAAAQIGLGFAQGKTLFWRRDILERGGGLAALGGEMAEDVASTKLVHRLGLKVRLPERPFAQPIGARRFGDVWQRQLRWARVRRLGFLPIFLPELVSGGALPFAAGLGLVLGGAMAPLWLLAGILIWYGAEAVLARAAGWAHGPADLVAWLIRDALIPALWLASWRSGDFSWRGNEMHADDPTRLSGKESGGRP